MAKRKFRAARAAYPSDLTDAQWALIAPLLPPAEPGGRDREVNLREVLNGILYLLRSGCSWRMLPHDLPPWGTVHYYYRRFRLDGTWLKLHEHLRTNVRQGVGRHPHPSAAILDSQSVKTTKKGDPNAATMPLRKSTAASVTCSSIPSAWFWPWWSMRPT